MTAVPTEVTIDAGDAGDAAAAEPGPPGGGGLEGVVRAVDRFQQRHRALAFPFAVIKKFGDDRGSSLAALFAYYGFLGLLPLLLLLVTGLGLILRNNPAAQQRVLGSALREIPIIGDQLGTNIRSLHARGLGLAVGVGGLLWGSLGIAQVGQHAMAQVWNVKGVDRPGFVPRLVRSLGLLGVMFVGLVVTTVLAGFGTGTGGGLVLRGLFMLLSLVVNLGLFVAVFRLLTPKGIDLRQLLPGAVAAGVAWSLLQSLGGYLVAHTLRHASQVYGFFGIVLGLLSFLSLAGTLIFYAAEANVVWNRRLWPRSIVQPPLTEADERVLAAIANQERRRPEQQVQVTYDDDPT